jgi:phosphoribosylamine--glycine ligase
VRVLIVGSGGREHALAWKLSQSPLLEELHAAPGNPGIAALGTCHPVRAEDGEGLLELARALEIDLAVIGPEAPLVAGVADELRHAGVAAFGPSAGAARIEGSKSFAKDVLAAAGVPTAAELPDARPPCVIKADGLAAGKGVFVCRTQAEVEKGVRGASELGEYVVIEELLEGPELSVFALTDGRHALPLAAARDHKRVGDGDTGPNTGGMGAYSPVEGVDAAGIEDIRVRILQPVVEELKRQGTPFHGVLYAGLMLTQDGPKVLEFNVRFGDPETQAVLPRLRSDLLDLMQRCGTPGGLAGASLSWDDRAAVTVVLASRGYPQSSSSGDVIKFGGVPRGIEVTHAGTAERDGAIVTAGGRVLNVTALGEDVRTARAAAYAAADVIDFDGKTLRRDIAA